MHWAAKRGFMKIMCTMRSAGACPKFPGKLYFFKLGDLSHFQTFFPFYHLFLVFSLITHLLFQRLSWQQHAPLCCQ